ncbi:sigma-54 interaction domain-containing protein [Gelria sp. Kuro-4]|uniref:sigma-54 interaction domain-containing protein n=1 Tax=Gelria sp. Kuro-4 TaxID=2796927 RepID=UPI00351D69CB
MRYTSGSNERELLLELEGVMNSSYDGLYVTDEKGTTLRLNPAFERITGLKKEELLGKNVRDLVKMGVLSQSGTHKAIEEQKPVTILQTIQGKKEILVTCTPIYNDQGKLFRVLTNARDITELNALKRQLEVSRELTNRYHTELQLHRELKAQNIVAESPAMKRVIEIVRQIAGMNATVLLLGESGVGKEVICDLIHSLSHVHSGPLIKVNCGAIPRDLFESEFFGYEAGAFTGARSKGKPGFFELAKGGTIFLDEVGELPLEAQCKLLRVLESNELVRLGGTKPIKVHDVRIIAATNRDLKKEVDAKRFRQDLYYRLNVVSIEIPPLRDRPQDVSALIAYYLAEFNNKHQKRKTLSPESYKALLAYTWPGNVRELKNTIERLVVLNPTPEIRLQDLPADMQQVEPRSLDNGTGISIEISSILPLRKAVKLLEDQLIRYAVSKTNSIRQAAAALGINHSTLIRKMQKRSG